MLCPAAPFVRVHTDQDIFQILQSGLSKLRLLAQERRPVQRQRGVIADGKHEAASCGLALLPGLKAVSPEVMASGLPSVVHFRNLLVDCLLPLRQAPR